MSVIASQITSVAIVYKKTSKLRVTGLCAGNSPGTGEFPAQMASNAENVSIWWRHHEVVHASIQMANFYSSQIGQPKYIFITNIHRDSKYAA